MTKEPSEGKDQSAYQTLQNLIFEELDSQDLGYEDAVKIPVYSDASPEEKKERAKVELWQRHWWLEPYWQEKGLPKEQFVIQIGGQEIGLYNFGEPLQEDNLARIKRTLEDFFSALKEKMLRKLEYILIDNEQKANPRTGLPMRGWGPAKNCSIKIYPKGIESGQYRVEDSSGKINFDGVDNLEGALIHELSHLISKDFSIEWGTKYFRGLDEPRELPGQEARQYFEPIEPQRCASEYAQTHPDEDVCESMVLMLRNPNALDEEKRRIIERELMRKEKSASGATVIKKELGQITLPQIDPLVKFRTSKKEKTFIFEEQGE